MSNMKLFLCMVILLLISNLAAAQSSYDTLRNKLCFLSFIPNTNSIIAVCNSDTCSVRIWSLKDGKLEKIINLVPDEFGYSLSLDKNGEKFVFLTMSLSYNDVDSLKCYSLKENRWLWATAVTKEPEGGFLAKFSQDEKRVISVNAQAISIYDADNGKILSQQNDFLKGFGKIKPASPALMNLSYDGNYLVLWQVKGFREYDGWFSDFLHNILGYKAYERIRFWNVSNNCLIKEIDRPEEFSGNSAITYDSKNIMIGDFDKSYRLYSLDSCKMLREWKDSSTHSYGGQDFIIISPNNIYYAIYYSLHSCSIWNYNDGSLVKDFNFIGYSPYNLRNSPMAFSPDEKYFAVEIFNKLHLYDIQTWNKIWEVESWPGNKNSGAK